MARNFKLNGNVNQKFKQLELILPRIMSHMSTKTYGVIPASVITSYSKVVNPGDFIFNGAMFAGRVKKVMFRIGIIEGEGKPNYIIRLESLTMQNKFMVETKKHSHVMEVNVSVEDGDVFTFQQEAAGVTLHDVYISALVEIEQKYGDVKEFVTEQLLETIENEGI